jgi:hypothetical protein
VAQAYSPSTQETKAGGLLVPDQPGLHSKILSQKQKIIGTLQSSWDSEPHPIPFLPPQGVWTALKKGHHRGPISSGKQRGCTAPVAMASLRPWDWARPPSQLQARALSQGGACQEYERGLVE